MHLIECGLLRENIHLLNKLCCRTFPPEWYSALTAELKYMVHGITPHEVIEEKLLQ